MTKKTYFLCIVLLSISSMLIAREIKIHIAVTTDVHARIFPYDFINDRPEQSSLAHVNYLLEGVRARQSGSFILLDNGDLLQGTPAAYYANFIQDSKLNLFSRVMNLMKYDAATIGNHDIEAGPAVYNRLKAEFKFPYLGANVLDGQTGLPYFEPYTVIRKQGIRVTVLGLTTPSIPNWLPPHLWEGLEFQDMVEAARHWVEHIRNHENPDVIVGLFHSGMGPLHPSADAHPLEQASAYIARNVAGIDVIFTGHDHRERIESITNLQGDDVLIIGGGHFAENIAVAELVFDRIDRRTFRLIDKKGELVSTRNIAPSQSFFRSFEKDMTEIIAFSNEQVVSLTKNMDSRDMLFGSSEIVDLVHHVQLELTGADISFTAPLIFDQTLRAGKLLVRDFFRLYEYENYLYTMELTGKEVLGFLEHSYSLWLNAEQGEDDPLLRLRKDNAGRLMLDNQPRFRLQYPFYSFDSAAGILYTVDTTKPVGERVVVSSMEDGSAFDHDRVYKVAINSYRGSGGGGHLTEGAGIRHADLGKRIISTTEKDLRSMMIDYFREKETIAPERRANWKIIPDNRLDDRKEKDMELLFD